MRLQCVFESIVSREHLCVEAEGACTSKRQIEKYHRIHGCANALRHARVQKYQRRDVLLVDAAGPEGRVM